MCVDQPDNQEAEEKYNKLGAEIFNLKRRIVEIEEIAEQSLDRDIALGDATLKMEKDLHKRIDELEAEGEEKITNHERANNNLHDERPKSEARSGGVSERVGSSPWARM